MSLLSKLDEAIDKLMQEEEVDEISTSAGAGAFDSKYAFGKVKKKDIEKFGYTQVKKDDEDDEMPAIEESTFSRMAKLMY